MKLTKTWSVTIVAMALMWVMSKELKKGRLAENPPPSPMAEANGTQLPPAPRLETDPPKDLAELREKEDEILGGYGWADKDRGLARIPAERAMEIVLKNGLPTPAAAPASSSASPSKGSK